MKVKINLMNSESNNKIALVTGASRGLGKFLSLELAKKGYDIILVARTVGALEEQYDEINKLGVKSTIVPLDLNEDNAIDNLGFEINKKWGRLDLLVSNAAITNELTPLSHLKPNAWNNIINFNLTINYRLIRSFEHLLKLSKDAKCLFILDKEVNENKPYHVPYSVSKAGLKKMITIWAKEVTKDNINIYYCFAPRMNTFLRKSIIPGLKESDFKNPEDISKRIIDNLSKTNSEDGNLIEIFC